ncbi:hypothetical protein MEG1DRAFT_04405 [Photorhabdus temperata subsp. temperata Meg1]|uniref:Uncharacterized protein n=1 Tax=Photorhabdus temperata subsp. temperata Meg1 TaxID=1393735 RepID=A0A081RQQ1_PHOTE|nr:hypothetical protein MEG1DRAFT_04405 [Photorhabdus temperata subsp. temperata Meg1]
MKNELYSNLFDLVKQLTANNGIFYILIEVVRFGI